MGTPSASSPDLSAIPVISSIELVGSNRAAWLVDIWGVMHNGVAPFAAAVAACQRFRSMGGHVLLLSNAPRPAPSVVAQLKHIGVPVDVWDDILTSGDAVRILIADLGARPVLHLGPERDLALYAGLGTTLVGDAERAEAISCTGLFNDEAEGPDDYRSLLEACAGRGLPMICANPDLKVERGNRIVYCAGALAQLYAELGGSVSYAGKPHLPIYHQAFERLAQLAGRPLAAPDVLAIGDGVHTDIMGACHAGVDAVFIASGVHVTGGLINEAHLDEIFPSPAVRPIAAMQELAWD